MHHVQSETILFVMDGLINFLAWHLIRYARVRSWKVVLMSIMCAYGYLLVSDLGQLATNPDWYIFVPPLRSYITRLPMIYGLGLACYLHTKHGTIHNRVYL